MPEIHWNTGNVGRTCVAVGAFLHLIRPLGFSLGDRYLKRAGMDYWNQVRLAVWDGFEQFVQAMKPCDGEVVVFTRRGTRNYWNMPRPARLFLIFGSETRGLPADILYAYARHLWYIPMAPDIRCLNLSTAVGIALYESLRPLQTSK